MEYHLNELWDIKRNTLKIPTRMGWWRERKNANSNNAITSVYDENFLNVFQVIEWMEKANLNRNRPMNRCMCVCECALNIGTFFFGLMRIECDKQCRQLSEPRIIKKRKPKEIYLHLGNNVVEKWTYEIIRMWKMK